MRRIGDSKKGQQMTLGTIILMVLGVVVLVLLIFGFSTGWKNMWSNIIQYGGGGVNVDDVIKGCEVACIGQSAYGYCEQVRKVNYGDGVWESGSCKSLKDKSERINIGSCDMDCNSKKVPILEGSEIKKELEKALD